MWAAPRIRSRTKVKLVAVVVALGLAAGACANAIQPASTPQNNGPLQPTQPGQPTEIADRLLFAAATTNPESKAAIVPIRPR